MKIKRKQFIERAAAVVRSEHGLARKTKLEMDDLVREMGIVYKLRDFGKDFSGAAMVEGRLKIISVNGSDSPVRQRFTAAHELGHLVLHEDSSLKISEKDNDGIYFRRYENPEDSNEHWKEVEANYFAACLLMPEDLILRELESRDAVENVSEDCIREMAKAFGVSEIAMTIRLSSLGYT